MKTMTYTQTFTFEPSGDDLMAEIANLAEQMVNAGFWPTAANQQVTKKKETKYMDGGWYEVKTIVYGE